MKRVIFYLFYDHEGHVDDYIPHKLRNLRHHAEHIFVVSNSGLTPTSRKALEAVADTVWERENVGFDVWGYKEAMQQFGGWSQLAEFDEVILMNYTFFGPISSFDDLFAEMDALTELDFWGITDHEAVKPHPYLEADILPAHIQSHWISIRKQMVQSSSFHEYWNTMPMINSYKESIGLHEGRFTEYFAQQGFRWAVAHPFSRFGVDSPALERPVQMLEDGCPIFKRRNFFQPPLYFAKRAISPRDLLAAATKLGYPEDMVLTNVVRTSRPRELMTNLALLDVLPRRHGSQTSTRPRKARVVAVVHVFYPDMMDDLLDRLSYLGSFDLVITTGSAESQEAIERVLSLRGRAAEVRVVGSNRGRDISAFYVDCRDVIESDDYDLIVKVHSKKSVQDTANMAETFALHLFENLLPDRDYVEDLLRLFEDHPSLGIAFPPVIHRGYDTLGRGWHNNLEPAKKMLADLNITVPLDETTPEAPYGSMFVARPAALRPLLRASLTHADFPPEAGYSDGSLAHVLERLPVYSAASVGFHAREVIQADRLALEYKVLEFRVQALAEHIPGGITGQVHVARRRAERQQEERRLARARKRAHDAGGLVRLKYELKKAPWAGQILAPLYRVLRAAYRGFNTRVR